MFKFNNKETRTTFYFASCSGVFIVVFDHVNVGW